MKLKIFIGMSLVAMGAFAKPALTQKTYIQNFWQEFEKNPQSAMNRIPFKSNKGKSPFTQEDILSKRYVEIKDYIRTRDVCKDTLPGEKCSTISSFSDIKTDSQNNLNSFFENVQPMVSLAEMDVHGLTRAELETKPWSGDYWPVYKGGISHRFADRNASSSTDFSNHLEKYEKSQAMDLTDQKYLDTLSPAEKYDILVGDTRMSLSQYAWSEGKGYLKRMDKVETWMGICHGWAPASYLVPRPTKVFQIPIPGQSTHLKFYPDDLKALNSMLWATTTVKKNIVGGRCNDKDPKADKNGRIISEQCFDTNPGAWHIAVVNQLGLKKKSFVLDATYDYEVWNQPVVSYSYKYFNPQTKREYKNFNEAVIAMKDFSKDKFTSYRSAKASHIVGVLMDLTYSIETAASTNETDSEKNDKVNTVTYIYDLELKADGSIIGGEWYQNKHPDMIWNFPSNAKAISLFENKTLTPGWDPMTATVIPVDWTKAAVNSSSFGQPLNAVMEVLQKLSH